MKLKSIGYIAVAACICAALFILPAAAADKEEVVYVNLNADGSVGDVYAVNIFDMPNGGHITDYGTYYAVKNLITTDAITENGDAYSMDVGPGKIYYQGDMGAANIPWNISIAYFLDGKEVPASALRGAAGHVDINMKISRNPAVNEFFYKNFALMVTMTLDANTCKNISADGATIADVGADKQLSYTILPNKTTNVTVSTDASKFSLAAITINGVKLMMDVDVDTKDTEQDLIDLEDGIVELDDGVKNLTDGINELYGGTMSLSSGAAELEKGLAKLDSMGGALSVNGTNLFEKWLAFVNTMTGRSMTKETYNSTLTYMAQAAGETSDHPGLNLTMRALLTGTESFGTGVSNYADGVSNAYAGSQSLSSGAGSLDSGAYLLVDGVGKIKDGTRDLRDNTTGLSSKLTDKIDELIDPLTGGDGTLLSFTSPKNTEISTVQFVMHTKAIELPEKIIPETTPEEDLNLFQRILHLFGLY